MSSIQIKIIDPRLSKDYCRLGSKGSAGYDLYACIQTECHLEPQNMQMIPSGIAIHIGQPSIMAWIVPRSGWGCKGLVLANTIGLIDSDYQGELKIAAYNRGEKKLTIKPMDRIAQLVFMPVIHPNMNVVTSFKDSERKDQGFGSSGD